MSVFGVILVRIFRILTEYGEIWSIYSVQMRENTDQNNSKTDTFYAVKTTVCSDIPFNNILHHIETRQKTCNADELSDLYMMQVLVKTNFWTNTH